MKPLTNVMEREGDLDGEKIAMQIDADATAHIMSVLTDLYSDTIMAVVREYSTNALDAHLAARQSRPIEVTTPTAMGPFFKVKDYGVGLDVDDIRRIYSKYGASTKRDSDEFNGVLGLGCKSALTYTNQFTVCSVKDGVKTTVSVSRTEFGGNMEVVSVKQTGEDNFTEVVVPTRDRKFEEKARGLFRFWKKGTVLLNGAEPAGLPNDAKQVVPGIYMVPTLDQDYVVMGNVAYPADQDLYREGRQWNARFGIVAFVEMGRVAFTPSREKLMMTPKTVDELNRIRRELKDGLHAQMRADIEGAPTHAEAYLRWRVWHNTFRQGVPNAYKGASIPISFSPKTVPNGKAHTTPYVTMWNMRSSRYSVNEGVRRIDLETIVDSLIVSEYDGIKIAPRHKEKIIQWLEGKNLNVNNAIFTSDDTLGEPWASPTIVTWEEIKAVKLPRAQVQRVARKAPYDVIQATGSIKQDSNIVSNVILFASPVEEVLSDNRYGRSRGGSATDYSRKALAGAFPTATIVQLAKNRWDKFKRDYPNSMHVKTYAKVNLEATAKALTSVDKEWMTAQLADKSEFSHLDQNKIDDPDVKAFLVSIKTAASATVKAYEVAKNAASRCGLHVPEMTASKPLANYPLVGYGARSAPTDHIYLYMNAIYNR